MAFANNLPANYVAIPIHEVGEGPLRLCVLVRQTPDPVAGHFVLLRDLHDALIYLGCVVDAGGGVREWVELWVQNVDGLESSLPAYRETFSNHSLDTRWAKTAEALRQFSPDTSIQTGWENKHPLPTFLDLSKGGPVHPAGDGGHWELCQKDDLLQSAGLPSYASSLFRYLYQPGATGEGKFVPVVAGAPTNARTRSLGEVLGNVEHHLPLNAQAGLIRVASFGPLGYEEYIDLLGGKPWKGIEHGKKHLTFEGVYRGLDEWTQTQQNGAHLFLGPQGRAGRFLETFHLKVQLLTEAVRLVRTAVQSQQVPFLNLSADSFRVRLAQAGGGLPFLWTAECLLVKPSHAYTLPVETSDFRYFICARAEGTSMYLPEGLSSSLRSSGSARIRKVLPPDQGRTILEGTLVMQERLNVSPHDLLWIRLPLPSGRIDLYGHLYNEGLAQGEARFRTVPQQLPESVASALRAAEGVSFARSPFEIVPLLSSPCDLFSLAVLAVRTLLVDEDSTLPVSLDEVLSLARLLASDYKADVPLGNRIRAVFEKDPRYASSLGCHRINAREKLEPKAAAQLLPPSLWHDTLGVIVRLFPGIGPDSVCKDYGDAATLALETVFNQPLAELESLLARSRSLIVIDWNANREIHGAIQTFLKRNQGG